LAVLEKYLGTAQLTLDYTVLAQLCLKYLRTCSLVLTGCLQNLSQSFLRHTAKRLVRCAGNQV